jgi:hypothetical protein
MIFRKRSANPHFQNLIIFSSAPGRKGEGPGHFWSLVVVQSSDFTTTARTLVVQEKMVVQVLNYRTGIGRSGTNGRPNLHDG